MNRNQQILKGKRKRRKSISVLSAASPFDPADDSGTGTSISVPCMSKIGIGPTSTLDSEFENFEKDIVIKSSSKKIKFLEDPRQQLHENFEELDYLKIEAARSPDPENCSVTCQSESVFGIHLIVKQILSSLDRKSLLNCRLVCRNWAVVAGKELQKCVQIQFNPYFKTRTEPVARKWYLTVDDLFENVTNSVFEFPCSYFAFFGHSLYSLGLYETIRRFLEMHGALVKILKVDSQLILHSSDTQKSILSLVPNLQILEVIDDTSWTFTNHEAQIPSQENSSFIVPTLKILKLKDQFGFDLIHWIIRSSPNLQSIELPTANLPYLLQPSLDRLDLLQNLKLDFDEDALAPLEEFAHEIIQNFESRNCKESKLKSKLAPKFLTVKVSGLMRQPSLWCRVSGVLNKLLAVCKGSIVKLGWDQMSFLHGLQMPSEMPNVEEIVFRNQNFHPLAPPQYFPEGVTLKMFPKLRCIRLVTNSGRGKSLKNYSRGFHDAAQVPGVVRFSIDHCTEDGSSLERFRWLFPNAKFTCDEPRH